MNQPTTPNTVEDFLPLPDNGPCSDVQHGMLYTGRQMRAYVLADRAQRPTVAGSVFQVELDAAQGTWLDVPEREVATWRRKNFVVRELAPAAPSGEATPAAPVVAEGLTELRKGLLKVNRVHDVEHLLHQVDDLLLAAHPVAGSPAEAEMIPQDVWQERVACARLADAFAYEEGPGERRYSGNVISARILARTNKPVETVEPMARFCPGCGSVGGVDVKYRDCCPDGGKARLIPEALAEQCHDLFSAALAHLTTPAAAEPMPASEAQTVEITRGNGMWHTNCSNHLGGPMKEVAQEPTRSIMKCLSCGKSGYYPVGGVGRVCSEEVAAPVPASEAAQEVRYLLNNCLPVLDRSPAKSLAMEVRKFLAAPAAPTDAKPTMICPQCGADRFKVPCPGMADECAMIADAHLQSVRDAAQPAEIHRCATCKRTSEVVELGKRCPFCQPTMAPGSCICAEAGFDACWGDSAIAATTTTPQADA